MIMLMEDERAHFLFRPNEYSVKIKLNFFQKKTAHYFETIPSLIKSQKSKTVGRPSDLYDTTNE